MPKRLFLFSTMLILVLSACKPASQPQASPKSTPASYQPATPVQAVSTSPVKSTQSAAKIGTVTATGQAASADCTVVSLQPTPEATEQSLFPPVTDQDWTQGPKEAYVTILEYGDFQ